LARSSDLIASEDLPMAHLVKNHHLAKRISDASWGLFLAWVRYDGQVHGIPSSLSPLGFTTQDCSGCGYRVKKSLSMRTHLCPNCGLVLDRDYHAALNILAAALVLVAAKHRTAGQAGTGAASAARNASGQTATTRCVRQGTRHSGWMKEESPAFQPGECQSMCVPVNDQDGLPLLPTRPARARRWVKQGKATPFWKQGVWCVRLNQAPSARATQPIAVGIDPGSQKEALVVKSTAHTYLNVQADAVTWVKDAVETRHQRRRSWRLRKTPCRSPRANRKRGGLPPSTKARWK
jgi:hypothetical protein